MITFGGTQRTLGRACGAARSLSHRARTIGSENALNFVVGIMLTSFGIFWSAEGAGVAWPGSDASMLMVIAFVVGIAVGLVGGLATWCSRGGVAMKWLKQFGLFSVRLHRGHRRIAVGVVGAVADRSLLWLLMGGACSLRRGHIVALFRLLRRDRLP